MSEATTTTHEEAIIPSEDLIQIEDGADLADETELAEQTADNILNVVNRRTKNRGDSRTDIIVVFGDWAYQDWSDYDVVGEQVALAGRIEDYSENAYFVRGAFELEMDTLEGTSTAEIEAEYITELLRQVDETETDFIENIGKAYWPKSAVEGIFCL